METLFKTLIKNIALTERQEEDARTKYNGICKTLHNNYYTETEYDGSTKLLIGSYAKCTNIRPPRDVDVIFKMPDSEFERFDNLSGNKQSQLLQEVRSVLKDMYATTEEISAFGKVVVIPFADGTHNVELLPAWQLGDGRFRIPDTENGGVWKIYDPIAEIKYISASNKKTGKTLDIIRICKKWTEYCNVPLKSFRTELIAVQYLTTLGDSVSNIDYAQIIKGFLEFLISKTNSTIISPAGETISLGQDWNSKAESALQRATRAVEYENNSKLEEAAGEWKKLFGDDFLLPEVQKTADVKISLSDKVAGLQRQYPSTREQFLEKDYGIPVKIDPTHNVIVDTWVIQDGFRPGWLTSFLEKRFVLRKSKQLAFSIRENSVPAPYSIMWKVRNFGDEARDANNLRGEISYDKGSEIKEENTKYYGEHYVECCVIKDRVCVAMDRILVPIGKDY